MLRILKKYKKLVKTKHKRKKRWFFSRKNLKEKKKVTIVQKRLLEEDLVQQVDGNIDEQVETYEELLEIFLSLCIGFESVYGLSVLIKYEACELPDLVEMTIKTYQKHRLLKAFAEVRDVQTFFDV
jgi:hypothetical protein